MLKPLACILFLSFLLGGCAEMWPKSKEWRLADLEENMMKLKKSQEETRTRLIWLESRITTIEKNLSKLQHNQQPLTPVTPATPSRQPTLSAPEESVKQPVAPAPTPVQSAPGVTSPDVNLDNEQELYQFALKLISNGKPGEARQILFRIQANFPKTKIMPNVLYWLGETYYDQSQFAQAILTFKQVIQKYPHHSKASDALLKIAYSYEKLDDINNAIFYLKILIQDYPQSYAADMARQKLKQLK